MQPAAPVLSIACHHHGGQTVNLQPLPCRCGHGNAGRPNVDDVVQCRLPKPRLRSGVGGFLLGLLRLFGGTRFGVGHGITFQITRVFAFVYQPLQFTRFLFCQWDSPHIRATNGNANVFALVRSLKHV